MRDPASPSSHGQSREPTGESSTGRTASDRCPGVFTPHPSTDGALARVRLLGGSITPEQLAVLAHVAAQYGDGFVDLTGRANVQIRGIADVDAVAYFLTELATARAAAVQ